MQSANEARPNVPVIVMTSAATVDLAVVCMKAGAYDLLTKPVNDLRLTICVGHAVDGYTVRAEVVAFEEEREHHQHFGKLIVHSRPMSTLWNRIENAAPSTATAAPSRVRFLSR